MDPYNENLSEEDRQLVLHYEAAVALGRLDYFDVDEMEIIIEHYLFEGDIDNAKKALEYGFKLHPGDRYLQCQKAAILLHRGKLRDALKLLDAYRDVDDPVHTFNRAEILYRLGQKSEALAEFRDLVDNSDESADIPGLCLDIIGTINRALDYKNSLYFFEKGLAVEPNNLDLLEAKALTVECLNRTDEAIALYNRVLDMDPYRGRTWCLLASLQYDEQNYREALTAYDYVLAIDPTDSLSLSQKAYCQYRLGDMQGAAESCKKYLEMMPTDDGMYTLLGECYESLEKPNEAQHAYQKAIEINPKNDQAWFGIGVTYAALDEMEKAKQHIRKALAMNPKPLEYNMMLVDILMREHNGSEVITLLQKVVRGVGREEPLAWKRLGDAYLVFDSSEKAQNAYERAILLCEKRRSNLDGLQFFTAVACYANEDYKKAQNYYNQAKRLDTEAKEEFLRIFPYADENLTL